MFENMALVSTSVYSDENMASKTILLLNGVLDGGVTYTEYLRQASLNLPPDADVLALNVPTKTKMDAEQVAEILHRPVQDIELAVLPHLSGKNFDILISNEASLGQFIDSSITTVFISHGSSAMPANSPHMYAEVLSYFDMITAASRASAQMLVNGMSLYRTQRRNLEIGVSGAPIRSDLRLTSLMPTLPMKSEKRHSEPQRNISARNLTIGLLPTAIGAIQLDVSLYHNLIEIIRMLLDKFPKSQVVFRPYPADLQRPQISQLCTSLKGTDRVKIDSPDSPSSAFYEKCDIVITDASTGGISSMLRKTVPPIYFVPAASLNNTVTRWFADNVSNRVPMAHSIDELENRIRYLAKANSEELFRYYTDYCDNELFMKKPQVEYFADIMRRNIYAPDVVRVDAYGEVDDDTPKAAA